MKIRIIQILILAILFVLGVACINSCSSNNVEITSTEGYIPPSP